MYSIRVYVAAPPPQYPGLGGKAYVRAKPTRWVGRESSAPPRGAENVRRPVRAPRRLVARPRTRPRASGGDWTRGRDIQSRAQYLAFSPSSFGCMSCSLVRGTRAPAAGHWEWRAFENIILVVLLRDVCRRAHELP